MAADFKSININNRTFFFFDDMTNFKDSDSNLLKVDKTSFKNMSIYYIGYITIKKWMIMIIFIE